MILGSGWAGYSLARKLDARKFQPVIVSPRSYFVFTPLLASTAVGTLEFRTAVEPIRSRRNAAQFVQGWADDVDLYGKTVRIEEAVTDPSQGLAMTGDRDEGKSEAERYAEGLLKSRKGEMFSLQYDKLVIAVGAFTQTFGTPGVQENALFLKDVGDARRIRRRVLECFEYASLPTTSDAVRQQVLSFAIVGGGPTGIEFAAELHDCVTEDLAKMYPDLTKFVSVTVYDVAPTVLNMFDSKLSQYAMDTFSREGIEIRTSARIDGLDAGLPADGDEHQGRPGSTLKIHGEAPKGVGMVVWSTGLMSNPFIGRALDEVRRFPPEEVIFKGLAEEAKKRHWRIRHDEKSGSVLTNDRLRVMLEATDEGVKQKAYLRDVFAIGDCAAIEHNPYPATAQVANQKAQWLGKHLNQEDLHSTTRFQYKNLGVMAYVGNWRAIVQGGSGMGDVSGRAAWLIWRGAYLAMSLSWRNRILIPIYWLINWMFGRDVSRF